MVRFGLFGAGRIGKIHGGNIAASPEARLVAIADADTDAAKHSPQRTAPRRAELDEIIGSPDIDAVLIGTPTDTHADLIERSVKAGKAVFCEKPVDLERRSDRCLPQGGRDGRHAADDRLQPALRPELPLAQEAAR